MPFELFTKETAAGSAVPSVSIQKKGIIALNRAAYAVLGQPQAVELFFDRERQLVGLRGADPRLDNAQRVRTNTNGNAYLVSAARFTTHYGIPTEIGHRWPAQMEGDLLVIDISKPPDHQS
jgi:hypothetical protein